MQNFPHQLFLWLGLVTWLTTGCNTKTLNFASFNIQIFGRSKASSPEVMKSLVKIIQRYDLVMIMEIRDNTGAAIKKLLEACNKGREKNEQYDMSISEPTGRTSSKEQYALFYKPSKAKVLEAWTLADLGDTYQREPYVLRVKFGWRREMILVGLHTDPEDTLVELNKLYADIMTAGWQNKKLLIAGDLNADCSYAPKRKLNLLGLHRDPNLYWLITDGDDTTVSKTKCAYDRLIVSTSMFSHVKNPRVFRFDDWLGLDYKEAKAVSDHYPVEVQLI